MFYLCRNSLVGGPNGESVTNEKFKIKGSFSVVWEFKMPT